MLTDEQQAKCAGCVWRSQLVINTSDAESAAEAAINALSPELFRREMSNDAMIQWAVTQWVNCVKHRPLENVHRRTLDSVWRRVISHAGGKPEDLIGPPHDELLGLAKGGK